jgi:hypothetical protein
MMSTGTKLSELAYVYRMMAELNGRIIKKKLDGRGFGGQMR